LDKNKVKEFFPFVIPVTTTSIGRISGYIAMSHVAASTLGTYDMAGHQIILSIFCCITPFVDALSQVAQSFVPAVFGAKERTQERANALRKTVNNFRLVGLGFGGVLVSLVACIPLISRYFTTDLVVLERVHSAIAPVGLFMLVNGLMCAGEGM
jgi:Na+-driven multidrug efflux pump